MPGKELKDVRRIAREFDMEDETARDFGDYLERCKQVGDRGTKNFKGDFTDDEMRDKAREFLGI